MPIQTEVEIGIREADKKDIEELINLIEKIFTEYDMDFDVDEELPDFLNYEKHYGDGGINKLLVAEHSQNGILAGCTALKIEDDLPRLSRVYVRKKDRGEGVGKRLVGRAVEYAQSKNYSWIHLWTDTRFERAHRFYRNMGYEYTGRVKPLGDINDSYEYHFRKYIGKNSNSFST